MAEMFSAVLGHDLRNPLSVITTSAETLMRRAPDETLRRPAARILSSGQRMGRMIEELLDMARARMTRRLPAVAVRDGSCCRCAAASSPITRSPHGPCGIAFSSRGRRAGFLGRGPPVPGAGQPDRQRARARAARRADRGARSTGRRPTSVVHLGAQRGSDPARDDAAPVRSVPRAPEAAERLARPGPGALHRARDRRGARRARRRHLVGGGGHAVRGDAAAAGAAVSGDAGGRRSGSAAH